MISKTAERAPKAIINLRISLMLQLPGFLSWCSSTESPASAITGKSVKKFRSRIWRGKSGRNGKNKLATDIEIILPKFALIVNFIYFRCWQMFACQVAHHALSPIGFYPSISRRLRLWPRRHQYLLICQRRPR